MRVSERINWTALANADRDIIDALLDRERVERKAKHFELLTDRELKIAVPVHDAPREEISHA